MYRALVDKINSYNGITVDTERKSICILASGGMDSTALIDYALSNGYSNISVFYSDIKNNPNKSKREKEALQNIIRYCGEEKAVYISFYSNEYYISGFTNIDMKQIPLHILSVLSAIDYADEIWIGYCLHDDAISYIEDIKNIINSYRPIISQYKDFKVRFPLAKISKTEIHNCIDQELLQFVTFCESEKELKDNARCGKCDICKRYDYELRGINVSPKFYHYNTIEKESTKKLKK